MIIGRMKALLAVATMFLATALWAQETLPDAPRPQNVPDAPRLPNATTVAPPPSTSQPPADPQTQQQTQRPAPKPEVKTVPQGGATQSPGPSQRDELYKFTTNVNFVMVPVTVKDDEGRPVYGLTKDNFKILENGVKQPISYFTSDPFAISAAIVVDVSMPEISLQKFQDTVQALIASFSEYDEVAVYTYGATVKQQQDFNAALGERTATTFRKVKGLSGTAGGAATTQGPMVTPQPTVNGQVFNPGDPSLTPTTSVRNLDPPRVLNDAILRAALDLSKRPKDRRRVIFAISSGREDRSTASYQDVLKVLLSNNVQVYAVGLDTAALPLYGKLSKVRLPRQPYGNILPKFANATGGEVINTLSRETMEDAYARLMAQARNQYTVGYTSPSTLSTAYRGIEVRVSTDTPVKVYARDGYYPLPPARK